MTVNRASNGEIYYIYSRYSDENPNIEEYGQVYLQSYEILHIPWLGFDGLACYLYQGTGNAHKVAVLEEGMKFQSVGIPPEQAQFLETRKFQINEIARLFRIPPHMVGDLEKSSFSNIEQQSLEFVMYTLDPWGVRWEQAIKRALFSESEKKELFVKFNVDGLLRGDYQSRMNGYAVGRQNGWLSTNDIRELENLNRIPEELGGDLYLINGNMTKLFDAGTFANKITQNWRRIMNKKFWNWVKNEEGRTLYFDGYIAQDSWFYDDITPKQFKSELINSDGDIVVWLNSPGGDVFAASQIYNMLKEYSGKVIVKIDGIAASAASVIAMAGSEILMSPVAMMMIHNPATVIFGEASDLQSGIDMLSEVKESIINAYEQKTSLPRNKISKMMDAETWFSAQKAVELGFADKVLYEDSEESLTAHYIQVDVLSKKDYTDTVKNIKELLLKVEFKRLNEIDLYEEDIKIYHKGLKFYYLEEMESDING